MGISNEKGVLYWEFYGAIVIIILGFVFHFAFFWFNQWKPLALFFAVNESVWEHCKIGFWPALLFFLAEYYFIKNKANNYVLAKATSLFIIPATIIVIFYTYTGIIGFNLFPIDISIFFIAVILGQYASYKLLVAKPLGRYYGSMAIVLGIILVISFSTFTFKPASIPIFIDNNSGSYGIPNSTLELSN
ncbi:MAG: hypothetical protein APF76_11915 [Desulfitibacter sp. BRH_c19]|nr:MAG: hypothetical protein APF76_11915 [Desulfitibacter sp. BRH_c19]